MKTKIEWANIRTIYRREVSRVLRGIEEGAVVEEDLEKLRNFCMISLRLQHKIEYKTWDSAKREAAITSHLMEGAQENPDLDALRQPLTGAHNDAGEL
jgi:hypothetical protein